MSFGSSEKFIYHLKNPSAPRAFIHCMIYLKFRTYVPDIAVISYDVAIFEILFQTLFMRLTVENVNLISQLKIKKSKIATLY